jgi:hypothetical protein
MVAIGSALADPAQFELLEELLSEYAAATHGRGLA